MKKYILFFCLLSLNILFCHNIDHIICGYQLIGKIEEQGNQHDSYRVNTNKGLLWAYIYYLPGNNKKINVELGPIGKSKFLHRDVVTEIFFSFKELYGKQTEING